MNNDNDKIDTSLEIYTHYRINPKTGKEIAGRFIWTPIDSLDCDFDETLVCNPAPTELLTPPDSIRSECSTLKAVGRLIEPNQKEIDELHSSKASILSLNNVCGQYYDGCTCGTRYDNNCAHYLSNAFILAGYSEILSSSVFTARCPHRRPIRAQDMLKWFQARQSGFSNVRIQRNTGFWATYQETSGWQHVVVIDTNKWIYYGTKDFSNWPVQWNYRIA